MSAVNRFMAGLLLWLVVSAVFTSWEGHLGGLLAGGAVAAVFVHAPRGRHRAWVQVGACLVVLALFVVLAAVKVADLTGGGVFR